MGAGWKIAVDAVDMQRFVGRADSSVSRREGLRRGTGGAASLAAVLGGFVVVGLVGSASSASAHTAGVPIPPESDYMIRWHQPHSVRPVDDWEIEVTPTRNPAGRFIATAQVIPEASCWALNVPVTEPATVRIRSVVGTQVSSWTRPTAVPEPGLTGGVCTAAGALSLLARRSRSHRKTAR